MKRFAFTRFAAITFGLFALVAAIAAVPVALERTGNIAAVSALFGMIAVSAVAGALLLPGRATIAMLRRTAIRTGTGPLITACALVMPIPMIVNLLSGLVPYWLGLSVTGCFLAAFVFPARFYRDVVDAPNPNITSHEAGMLMGRKIRENRLFFWLFTTAGVLLFASLVAYVIAPQSLPSAAWRSLGGTIAMLLAFVTTTTIMLPFFQVTPKGARARTWPGLSVLAGFALLMGIAGYRAILLDVTPAIAARMVGEDVTRSYQILSVEPRYHQKFCSARIRLMTETGPFELCNVPAEALDDLAQENQMTIAGKATWFGLYGHKYRIPD
ncbi:hypothetical protein [Roseovarius arcticus]|uniref:hypothetical protein n=1 Tax=Roseovarius arcticus TaxID=2547404 RepID=UPI0011100DA7|nr:hypothetical protein [Roseovarius arcticus]